MRIRIYLIRTRHQQATTMQRSITLWSFPRVSPLVIVLFLLSHSAANIIREEICDAETFEGRCESGQVMVMKSARYGRMRLGRCVKVDMGHLGCSRDVLSLFDGWCSGKQACDVLISNVNTDLSSRRSCISEILSYMEIAYTCTRVAVPSEATCRSPDAMELTGTPQTISSHVTDESACGGRGSPWVIRTSPGQRVSLVLVDFGGNAENNEMVGTICQPYGYISEPGLGVNRTVCGGLARETQVYTSSSSHVVIQLIPTRQRERKSAFLLQYDGCPDIKAPPNAWYKRNGSKAAVGCEWSEHSWHLTCEGNVWVGVVGNCSSGEKATQAVPEKSWSLSPLLSVSLIIGLGVLVVALVCIALIGCVCMLSGKRRTPAQFQPSDQQQSFLYHPGRAVPNQTFGSTNITQTTGGTLCAAKPTATDQLIHIWETPLPIPKLEQSTTAGTENLTTMSGRGTLPGPPLVYKDGSTMSRSDYSTDTYWAGTDRYFDNDLGWVTLPKKE